jgi:hypothetical protein
MDGTAGERRALVLGVLLGSCGLAAACASVPNKNGQKGSASQWQPGTRFRF